MAVKKPRVGVDGLTILVTVTEDGVAKDISSATTKDFYLQDPIGRATKYGASFVTDGSDGKLKYVTTTETLYMAGEWEIQARIIISGGGDWPTDTASFIVYDNLW